MFRGSFTSSMVRGGGPSPEDLAASPVEGFGIEVELKDKSGPGIFGKRGSLVRASASFAVFDFLLGAPGIVPAKEKVGAET